MPLGFLQIVDDSGATHFVNPDHVIQITNGENNLAAVVRLDDGTGIAVNGAAGAVYARLDRQ